jgi:molybdenum cofactor synthesis domain-containing protein
MGNLAARAAVVTVSDRSAMGERRDESGPLAAGLLAEAGWPAAVTVTPDEIDGIRAAVADAIDAGARLVVTTGGTGIAPRDVTPEAMDTLLDKELPGIAEAIRAASIAKLPQGMLSRARAGIRGNALVVNLPGSPGAVRDGIPIILQIAGHVVSQLGGGDHE